MSVVVFGGFVIVEEVVVVERVGVLIVWCFFVVGRIFFVVEGFGIGFVFFLFLLEFFW